jgi:hypothetical protein
MPSSERTDFATFVEKSYSQTEARRFLDFTESKARIHEVAALGNFVLKRFQRLPGACAPMSATWTDGIRACLSLPAFCVAGDLLVQGRRIFGNDDPTAKIAMVFDRSTLDWDGHCWVRVGDYVADISLFRTAYSEKAPRLLHEAIVNRFGRGRDLLVATADAMREDGFTYVSKYVLTESQVDGLIRGVRDLLESLPE